MTKPEKQYSIYSKKKKAKRDLKRTKNTRIEFSDQKNNPNKSLSKILLVDLRLPEEFEKYHIKNGRLISR